MVWTSALMRSARASSAVSRSYFDWRFIHICAEVPKNRARRRAVSAEIDRRPLMISVSRFAGMRSASESAFAVMPASPSTVFKTSPGWTGGSFPCFVGIFLSPRTLVVVRNLDIVGVSLAPPEADSELIVDSDAVLPGSIPLELLQAKSGQGQIRQRCSRIQQSKFHPSGVLNVLESLAR